MHELDIALAFRNALLLQFLVMLLLPEQVVVAVHRHLQKAWKWIQAPLREKKPPRKGSRFWEVDMTKFEP